MTDQLPAGDHMMDLPFNRRILTPEEQAEAQARATMIEAEAASIRKLEDQLLGSASCAQAQLEPGRKCHRGMSPFPTVSGGPYRRQGLTRRRCLWPYLLLGRASARASVAGQTTRRRSQPKSPPAIREGLTVGLLSDEAIAQAFVGRPLGISLFRSADPIRQNAFCQIKRLAANFAVAAACMVAALKVRRTR